MNQLRTRLSGPIIAVIVGAVLFIAGLILGRLRYSAEPGYYGSAMQVDALCRSYAQVAGHAATDPSCGTARTILDTCGALIVAGIASLSVGIALAVTGRRARTAAERQAAIARHPSSRSAAAR